MVRRLNGFKAQIAATRALQAVALALGLGGALWHGMAAILAGGAVAWFLGLAPPNEPPPPPE